MRKIYLLLILLITSAVSFGQEVLVNGDFESWDDVNTPTGWTIYEDIEQESTEINGGTYSAKQTGGRSDLRQVITGITPGTSYTISLWYKVESGDDSDARIWSYWRSEGSNLADNADELRGPNNSYFDTNGNLWTEYSVTVTAPATADEFYFEVRTYSGAVVYWDDFSFFQEAEGTPTLSITSPTNGASVVGPDVDVELSILNFEVGATDAGLDGHIHYSLDAGGTVMVYDTDPIALTGLPDGEHTVDVWLVDNTHTPLDPPVEASVTFTVTSVTEVADLATLRASAEGGIYEVTGEVIVSFVTGNNRNQIFIQDATAGMLIDDNSGTITTAYMDGDGITGLTGQLGSYADMLQFVPTEDPGAATSSANSISPQMVTLTDLENNLDMYESELVMINGVTFADGDGTTTFSSNTNYDISDSTSSAFVFRTNYPNDNLEGELIPNTPVNIMTLAGEFFGTPQVYPTGADYLLSVNEINSLSTLSMYPNPVLGNQVTIQTQGNGTISVSVFDVLGKNVLNKEISNNTLNVSSLKSGIYLVRISQNGFNTTKKLVVK
ncbi:T9SS type A sorting domain-containing protein [Mangrovimonas sp. AS39]|uniref:T9SS type A sorting domain-containing protein n=1 Tax=Mangrovimonas futianensis TaxID=2895523 RepID=UPI001E3A4AC0|nr:T9SS type A sorting domain-containing protein [Mangrovimonas futianensis]MCF1191078.1 T9SS type A sorting domain-containing protein [Mangrovimonas futianensis]MCF1194773.1 T9SS type A sorting domain-containing protein [Mangrovimonas futianensis]